MLPERPRTPDRPRMPALTDAECSVVDHYLAVVDLLARINPTRSTGHTYPALRAAQSLATEARVLLEPREGPAGWRSVIATPAGAEIAFWQPKEHHR